MPSNVVINYKGLIHPNELEVILADEQMMFLPTLNENFGHSIVESLLCGCPVIISDQTPWIDLEKNNAGFSIPLNNTLGFINAITKMAKLNQEDYLEKSNAAIKYISSKIEKEKTINLYKNLFNDFIKN
jgi:glycosyltransferase involved in cell wall biosynthesis